MVDMIQLNRVMLNKDSIMLFMLSGSFIGIILSMVFLIILKGWWLLVFAIGFIFYLQYMTLMKAIEHYI